MIRMEKRQNQPLTKERIVGMQVVDADGYFVGKVRDISLCVGEMDQALVIETTEGDEEIHRWSEVTGAGDVILLRAPPPEPHPDAAQAPDTGPVGGGARHCGSCGAAIEPGTRFCGSCGSKVG